MKNKKWIFLLFVVFILIVYISIVFMTHPKNDIASREKMISKRIKTNETVMIYNSIVGDDYRLSSYVLKGEEEYQKAGYGHFRKNRDGNYELIDIIDADTVTKEAHDIILYEFSELKVGNFPIETTLFIISNNPKLAKIEQIMDNGEIQIKEITENPSITFFQYLDKNSKVKYKFYDKNGDILR